MEENIQDTDVDNKGTVKTTDPDLKAAKLNVSCPSKGIGGNFLKFGKKNKKTNKKPMPSAYIILIAVIMVVVIATWIGSWVDTAIKPSGVLDVFWAPVEGFVEQAPLIVFLLCIGGMLQVVTDSRALEAGLGGLIKRFHGKEVWLIPILMTLFSLGGAIYGMCEETIPFYFIILPVILAGGFDAVTGMLIIMFGAGFGTAASIINPFVVNMAVDAANGGGAGVIASTTGGIVWRIVAYVVFVGLAISFVTWYGMRVKRNPKRSVVYDSRVAIAKEFSFDHSSVPPLTGKRKTILYLFAMVFVVMIASIITWGSLSPMMGDGLSNFDGWFKSIFPYVTAQLPAIGDWYLIGMAFLFFIASVLVALLDWKSETVYRESFFNGSKDFLGVCFIIAVSKGISVILTASHMDTEIIAGLSTMIKGAGGIGTMMILFVVFIVLSILIPSTSGLANASFGIIGPSLVAGGMTVSGGIAAFSFASGLVNMFSPTAALFMAGLAICKVDLVKYYKAAWPLLAAMTVAMIILLIVGGALGTSGLSPIF